MLTTQDIKNLFLREELVATILSLMQITFMPKVLKKIQKTKLKAKVIKKILLPKLCQQKVQLESKKIKTIESNEEEKQNQNDES